MMFLLIKILELLILNKNDNESKQEYLIILKFIIKSEYTI